MKSPFALARIVTALVCLAALAGCVAPTPAPTPVPPTATAVPPTATNPPPPPEPSATSEPSPTPTTEAGQPSAILIIDPARNSVVTNPLFVRGEADPTFEQGLIVQVSDESGNAITQVYTTIAAEAGQRGPFQVETSFRVDREQPGRISVYSVSPRDGGIEMLESVEVTLSPGAPVALDSNAPYTQPIQIFEPVLGTEVGGGALHVTGYSVPVFESQLGAMLCGEGGSGAPDPVCGTVDNILAQVTVFVQSPDIGQPGPFDFFIEYNVPQRVSARLAIFDASARDGGLTMLTSRYVVLTP